MLIQPFFVFLSGVFRSKNPRSLCPIFGPKCTWRLVNATIFTMRCPTGRPFYFRRNETLPLLKKEGNLGSLLSYNLSARWIFWILWSNRCFSTFSSLPETFINLTKEYSFENNLEIDDMTVYVDLNENPKPGQDNHVCKAVLASLVTNVEVPSQGKNIRI